MHSCCADSPPPFGWKTILPLAPSDDSLATNWSCVTKPHSVRVSYGSDFDVDDVCGVDDGAPTFWNGSRGLAHLPWRSLMAYRERLHQVTKSLPVVTGQLFSCFVFLSEKISNSISDWQRVCQSAGPSQASRNRQGKCVIARQMRSMGVG